MDLNSKFSSLQQIKFSLNGQVATISLNRPSKGNALSNQMGQELQQIMNALDNEFPRVRVVVLTGEGKYFCTGMDLGSLQETGQAPISPIQIFSCLRNSKLPIIAKLNGPVMAGGTVALKDSYMVLPEVKRGIVPALISTLIVPQLGLFKTKQAMITGEKISAEELFQRGVLSAVVNSKEELEKETARYIEEILSGAPNAISESKALANFVSSHSHEENVQQAVKTFSNTVTSPEAVYGVSCFIQKQKPDWTQLHSKL